MQDTAITSIETDNGELVVAGRQLDRLLRQCVELDASDLHLRTDSPPYWRIHGVLEPLAEANTVDGAQIGGWVESLLDGIDRKPLEQTGSIDGAISGSDGTRFRYNIYRRQGTLSIAFRRLEDQFRSLQELGLPESLYELCDLPDGLVVVAGPTGSGKSTTLATLLNRINRTRRCHIVTIEDPIEYLHDPQQSLINQRQIGIDASSFNDALVASLRQDPDVVLVGEIRDLNTIRTAITAAETGHLVFTTVHAGDCVGAIERLVSVFPADEQSGIRRQLSLVLRAVIAQHLVVADGQQARRPQSDGVVRRSRTVTSEILRVTPAVGHLVTQGKSAQIYSAIESGGAQGMQTLEQDLARLLVDGTISEVTATTFARNPQIVEDRARRLRAKPRGTRS